MSMQRGMFPASDLSGVKPAANDDRSAAPAGTLRVSDLMHLSTEMRRMDNADLCPKGLSVLLADSDAASVSYREWVAQMGGNLMVVSESEPPMQWVLKYADKLDFLLVDSDYIGDVEDTVDFCIQLRRAKPGLKIILISSEVRDDDFTTERMMACDATLKAPFSESRLRQAVAAAQRNNDQGHYSLGSRLGLSEFSDE